MGGICLAPVLSRFLLLVAALGGPGCFLDEVDLTGKECPCGPGFRCDEASFTCVQGRPDAGAADGGAVDGTVEDGGSSEDAGPLEDGGASDGGGGTIGEGVVPVMVAGHDYEVTTGATLELVVPPDQTAGMFLPTSRPALGIPSSDSGYAGEVYVSVNGSSLPEIWRVRSGAFERFTISDGVVGPDGTISSLEFTPSGSPWGETLVVPGISEGAGDGVFTVSPSGAFTTVSDINNVWSLDYDCVPLVGSTPARVVAAVTNDDSVEIITMTSAGTYNVHQPSHRPNSVTIVHVPCEGWGRGTLFIGGRTMGGPPYVETTTSVEPWVAPVPWLTPSDTPWTLDSTVGPFGDVVLLAAGNEVRAYREDGSSYVVVSSAGIVAAIAYDDGNDVLYLIDGTESLLLRVVPSP